MVLFLSRPVLCGVVLVVCLYVLYVCLLCWSVPCDRTLVVWDASLCRAIPCGSVPCGSPPSCAPVVSVASTRVMSLARSPASAVSTLCVCVSLMSYNTTTAARCSARAEALAVARRPKEASREKNPAAAGIERFCILFLQVTLTNNPAVVSLLSRAAPNAVAFSHDVNRLCGAPL